MCDLHIFLVPHGAQLGVMEDTWDHWSPHQCLNAYERVSNVSTQIWPQQVNFANFLAH